MEDKKLSEKIWEQSVEWVDEIGSVITELAKQLGVASEHVYTIYTKQVFFEGLVKASASAFFVILLFIATLVTWFVTRKYEEEAKWIPRLVSTFLLLLIGSLVIADGLIPNLLKTLNPEYYTIKQIMEMLGKVVD